MDQDDLDRELQTHLDLEAAERREAGAPPEEAADAARRALGNLVRIREEVRALSPWSAVGDFVQDLRYGLRMLRKHPAFAIAAAITLALGIGSTTAIFSVVDAVLLRPLPYPDADGLAMVWENVNLPAYKNAQNTPAPGNFRDWRTANSTFVDLAAVRGGTWSLTGGGEPLRVAGERATVSLFRLLGVKPALGRLFTSEEDTGGSSRVALLGHALWAERFGSSASIVGRTIRLDDEPYLVVGVLPPGFHPFDPDDELWLPLGLPPAQLANHDSHYLRVLGRLKPGVTLAQAQADLDTIAARLTAQYPLSNGGVGVTVTSLREQTVGDVRLPLLILLGVTGLLLLMVCANIGNLLIARASSRAREFALRAAVGATRARLVRQMLAESALLAAIGGGLGLALAAWGVSMLRWLAPSSLPRVADVGLNAPVAGVDIALALVAGVLCGLMPAWQSRDDLHDTLRDESRGSATRARLRAGNVLVVVETGLGVVVLVGAGLLLRSFLQLTRVPVGFEPRGVLTLRVSLPPARYTALSARAAFYTDVAERLRALPGARSAAGISFLPLTMQGRTTGLAIEGDSTASVARFADFRSVTPGYFASMSIPLVAGRDVAWTDTPASPLAVVVSETLARTFWPGQDPLGRRLKLGRPGDDVPWLTVIGVVGDVRLLDLLRPSRPAMYFPALQDQGIGDTVRDWVVRTATTDPTSLAGAVRRVVWAVDPALPVTEVRTMGEIRSAATASQRFNLLLVGLFAALALVLAAVGVYGVTAHGVAQRTRELGIRIALGARRGALLRLVLGHGAGLAAAGLVLGAAIALALSRLLSALLFGVGARDPLTFVTVSLVLLAVSLAASFVPAWRATSVDPVTALRV